MVPRRIFASLLAIAVSGCVVPQEPDEAIVADTRRPTTFPWGISGCDFVIAVVPVDEAALAERLPSGFRLLPSAGLVGDEPAVHVDAYVCDTGVGLNGTELRQLEYGSYYVPVAAPEELVDEGYQAVFVKWDFLVPDQERRERWSEAGLPAHDGSASVSFALGPASVAVEAELRMTDAGGFRLNGRVGPLTGGEPLPFMEYTPLVGGSSLARWHARLHDHLVGEGHGVLQIESGSWLAGLVGTEPVAVSFIAGRWNLDEADVAFPLPWPGP